MRTYEHLLDAVGNTPVIRLRRITGGLTAPVYGKAEFLNPGGSVKDRTALGMIREAERSGELRPGGVIVEATSGNTGLGLVMVAAHRGYRSIIVVPDKSSKEKIILMRALGAEVITTPAALPREHPDHVLQVARRITAETPGAWYANQYDNPANPEVHRTTTGPEIWEQTDGRITHFVAGIGTGGTISGAGGFLKEISAGRVQVIGADPFHSAYSGGDGSPYYVESIGRYLHPQAAGDVWPKAYDSMVVDRFERIPDRESLITTRRLAREEGLLVGGSAGTAVAAALRVAATATADSLIVVMLPDTGRSYLSKYFDDDWLRRLGFTDAPTTGVGDLIPKEPVQPPRPLTTAQSVADALGALCDLPEGRGLHPVVMPRPGESLHADASELVGTVERARLRARAAASPEIGSDPLSHHMDPPLRYFGAGETVEHALGTLNDAQDDAWVLVEGAIAGVVSRAQLASAAVRARGTAGP
ncbi:PLP-dependent cysteine synthase family protein [Streptomyces canus]|uniref:PLP-dependent cysteine synthase family protein n=1 Tax=Streptomyces canus TaxID=58343 RepID=UPI0033B677B1